MTTYFREIRELNNKTQQEVAEALNVSPQSVSKWENDVSLPSVEFLPRLANIYGCSISTFFKESEVDLYKRFFSLNDKECLGYIFEVIRSGDPHLEIPNNVGSYPLESFLSKQLYEYLKSAEIFSIKDLQKCLKTEFSQVINIVNSLRYFEIVAPSEDAYDFRKDKLDVILPYCNDNLEAESLGILFKRLRVHFHETQKSLAHLVNVSQQAVGKWERGISLPSVEILLQLASHYGCSVDSFFSLYECDFYTEFCSPSFREGVKMFTNLMYDQHAAEQKELAYSPSKEDVKLDYPIESLCLDAVYDLLKKTDKISTPIIQRSLNLGYAVASNIIDFLYLNDIISYIEEEECWQVNKDKVDTLSKKDFCHFDSKI